MTEVVPDDFGSRTTRPSRYRIDFDNIWIVNKYPANWLRNF